MNIELESSQLKLQEVTESDIEQIHELNSYLEVDKYNTLGIPEDMDVTEKFVRSMIEGQKAENRKSYYW